MAPSLAGSLATLRVAAMLTEQNRTELSAASSRLFNATETGWRVAGASTGRIPLPLWMSGIQLLIMLVDQAGRMPLGAD